MPSAPAITRNNSLPTMPISKGIRGLTGICHGILLGVHTHSPFASDDHKHVVVGKIDRRAAFIKSAWSITTGDDRGGVVSDRAKDATQRAAAKAGMKPSNGNSDEKSLEFGDDITVCNVMVDAMLSEVPQVLRWTAATQTRCGTEVYVAPEVVHEAPQTEKLDIADERNYDAASKGRRPIGRRGNDAGEKRQKEYIDDTVLSTVKGDEETRGLWLQTRYKTTVVPKTEETPRFYSSHRRTIPSTSWVAHGAPTTSSSPFFERVHSDCCKYPKIPDL
ncbi:MAG: hypothetical protein M1816_003865 [Peltula sp. TS41687]|nr:MAG: hypothetical protein M1816_003865 [Peltula sp. TS41687]